MLCQCAKRTMQHEWESLSTKFVSLSLGSKTMSSESASWLIILSIYFCFFKKIMGTCALVMNTSGHFDSSLTMFPTMSCDRVSSLMLVTSHNWHMLFGLQALTLVAWAIFECFLLLHTFHVHVHRTWLCMFLCRKTRHLEYFSLFHPLCTNTYNLLSSSSLGISSLPFHNFWLAYLQNVYSNINIHLYYFHFSFFFLLWSYS